MDHPIEQASVNMVEKKEWLVREDNTLYIEGNMDHPIGQDKIMERGQMKLRCQVDTKVEIVHYNLYQKNRGHSFLANMG